MFSWILKRHFTNQVHSVIYQAFSSAKMTGPIFEGGAFVKPQFMVLLDMWLRNEREQLDQAVHSSRGETGILVQRGRIWVGVYLVHAAYAQGATDVPRYFIKKFWKPACTVAEDFLEQLLAGAGTPFSSAFEHSIGRALEGAA